MKARLADPAPTLSPSEYWNAAGRFSRPGNLNSCLELAQACKNARFVAGNTDLGVMTNLRDERFPHLISLDCASELRGFRDEEDFVEIGAGLTLTEIGDLWTGAPPIFREWLPLFASPLIRNRATWGGNLATASPIGDSAPMLLALGASICMASLDGERTVPLAEFFRAYRQTALGAGEIIRAVRIPKAFPARARFFKVAKRSMDDISTVAAAIAANGNHLTIGFGGVAATPLKIEAHNADDAIYKVSRFQPISDHRGSAEYRQAMAISLIRKFVEGA